MTFNEIGRHALARVGRNKLWFDMDAMMSFATTVEYRDKFEGGVTFDGRLEPELAPAAVALETFTQQPGRWHFVEIIGENWEDSLFATQQVDAGFQEANCKPAGETRYAETG